MSELPLNAGTLPSPYTCWQALYEQMFSLGSADGPAITGILIQDTTPDPEDHDKGWIPTASDIPIYPGYVFVWHDVLGHWVSRHPKGASDPRPEMYIGSLIDLPTFDGGDTGAPGVASGPMWEQWIPITGRVPVGVGLIPGSSPAATIAAPLDTTDSLGNSGEYKHVLTGAEGAVDAHTHPIGVCDPASDDAFLPLVTPAAGTPTWTRHLVTGGASPSPGTETTANLYSLEANDGNGVTSDGHNNMMPWLGVYWIQRTARVWFVAA